jgi:hypothetical protein
MATETNKTELLFPLLVPHLPTEGQMKLLYLAGIMLSCRRCREASAPYLVRIVNGDQVVSEQNSCPKCLTSDEQKMLVDGLARIETPVDDLPFEEEVAKEESAPQPEMIPEPPANPDWPTQQKSRLKEISARFERTSRLNKVDTLDLLRMAEFFASSH